MRKSEEQPYRFSSVWCSTCPSIHFPFQTIELEDGGSRICFECARKLWPNFDQMMETAIQVNELEEEASRLVRKARALREGLDG